jgi:hypothetical protein
VVRFILAEIYFCSVCFAPIIPSTCPREVLLPRSVVLMRKIIALGLTIGLLTTNLLAQSPPQNPSQQPSPPPPQKRQDEQAEDILRITTELVQTDVVVTDKSDQIVSDRCHRSDRCRSASGNRIRRRRCHHSIRRHGSRTNDAARFCRQ